VNALSSVNALTSVNALSSVNALTSVNALMSVNALAALDECVGVCRMSAPDTHERVECTCNDNEWKQTKHMPLYIRSKFVCESGVLQCVAVCAVCCSVLQCVAVCCGVLQCAASIHSF